MRKCRDAAALGVIVLLLHAAPRTARANDEVGARAAYDRATVAFDAGDFATAAREYERADELAPHPTALRWALVSATKANDAVLAMTLANRAERNSGDADLAAAVEIARERFSNRVGALVPRCPLGQTCTVKVDGVTAEVGVERFVIPGEHQVELSVLGEIERRTVRVLAEERLEVQAETVDVPAPAVPTAPSPQPTSRPPVTIEDDSPDGLSPAWILVGAGATLALGGVLVWSGLDTVDQNDAYLVSRDQAAYDDGRAAELRTNVLVGATALAGIGTAALAVWGVDWSGEAHPEVAISIAPSGVGIRGSFR